MFQFPGFASIPYVFRYGYPATKSLYVSGRLKAEG